MSDAETVQEEAGRENEDAAGLSWEEAKRLSHEQLAATKTFTYNMGTKAKPAPVSFRIRMLKQREKDAIEQRAVRIDPRARSDEKVTTDTGLLKRGFIEAGVTAGPEGWRGGRKDFDDLCANTGLRDELADAIEKFAQLDEETRVGFR